MASFVGADNAANGNIDVLSGTWPAGVADGDIAVMPWTFVNTATPTDPTQDAMSLLASNTDGSCTQRVLYRYCTGSESGTISTSTGATFNRQSWVLAVFRGFDFISGFAIRLETTTGASHANPQLTAADGFNGNTPADGDTIVIITSTRDGATVTVVPPAGYTIPADAEIGVVGSGGTHTAVGHDDLTGSVTLPTTPAAWTSYDASSGTAVTTTLALRPLAAAVTGSAVATFGFTGASNGVDRALGAAAAAFGFTATAAGVDRAIGLAVAQFGFTGSASGTVDTPAVTGAATAAFGFTATTVGTRRVDGFAAAAFGFASVASGVDRSLGLAVALLGFTGLAAGIDRSVGAAGAGFGFVATVAGIRDVPGAATAVFGFTGSAQGAAGTPPVTGTALAAFGFTATTQGQPRTPGVAVAAFGFTSTAAGSPRVIAVAVASFGFTGSGVGERSTSGVAQALLGFTATIAGLTIPPVVYGTATAATGSAAAAQASPAQTAAASPGVMPVPTATGG